MATHKERDDTGRAKWKKVMKKTAYRHVAILNWLPNYTRMDAASDFIAGITLGLTIVPQSIAYAGLAGLTPEIGLNSAFAGGFLYVLFGTIKQVSIGPTSLMSLLTMEYTKNFPPEYIHHYVFLLTFMCGCVELIMGIFRLGFLVDVISAPVISGFTSASALIIIVSQIKEILGIKLRTESFADNIVQLAQTCHKTQWTDAVLGISCIVILLLLRKLKDLPVSEKSVLKQILWFISIGRNAIVVLISCILTYAFELTTDKAPFYTTKTVQPGLPNIQPPSFGMQQGNVTVSLTEMVHQLRSGIFVIPIVAVLINVSIAKAFATTGKLDATQEMLTLSLCNIFASFLKCMPICGAFTRSAVSNASGVRTPFANFYSALLTIFALTFLTPYFHYIPRATLGAVLIAAVVFLIDIQIMKPLWRSCKRDLVITISTLVVCLYYGVEIGLLLGVLANLAHLIYLWARPSIAIDKCKNERGEYIVVTPDLGLFYPAIDHLNSIISKTVVKNSSSLPIAINCCYFKGVDYSVLKSLSNMVEDFSHKGQKLVFFNATDEIQKVSRKSGYKNLQFCAFNQNLDDLLFGERTTDANKLLATMDVEQGTDMEIYTEMDILNRKNSSGGQ